MNFIAFKKLPCFLANLAEKIPGLLFKASMHKPESSEITGKFTYLEKKISLKFRI